MIRRLLFALLLVPACSSSDEPPPPVPDGITCASAVGAADTEAANRALGQSSAGACVVLTGTSYDSLASVKQGVIVTSAKNARATIKGAVLEGGTLAHLDVVGATGNGVTARGGTMTDVKISGAKNAAL